MLCVKEWPRQVRTDLHGDDYIMLAHTPSRRLLDMRKMCRGRIPVLHLYGLPQFDDLHDGCHHIPECLDCYKCRHARSPLRAAHIVRLSNHRLSRIRSMTQSKDNRSLGTKEIVSLEKPSSGEKELLEEMQ
jgi:hypothetical protein